MSVDQLVAGQVNSLYVANLPPTVTEAELFNTFNDNNNPITSLRVVRDANNQACYAYLNFNTPEHASAVLKESNFKELSGYEIVLSKNIKPTNLDAKANLCMRGEFSKDLKTSDYHKFFSQYGELISVRINKKGDTKVVVYIQYTSPSEAQKVLDAVAADNTVTIADIPTKVNIDLFQPRAQRARRFTNVFVRNFPINFSKEQFTELCAKYGKVTSCYLPERVAPKPGTSDPSKTGYGFANYESSEDAQKAIAGLCSEVIGDYTLQAFEAKDKEARQKEVAQSSSHYSSQFASSGAHPSRAPYALKKNNRLFIRLLPADIDFNTLSQRLQKFGEVQNVKINKMRNTADATFAKPEQAAAALAALGKEWSVSYFKKSPYPAQRPYPAQKFNRGMRRPPPHMMMPHHMMQQPYPQYYYAHPGQHMMQPQYHQQHFQQQHYQQQPPQQQTFNTRRKNQRDRQQPPQQQQGAPVVADNTLPLSDDERQQVGSQLYYAIQPLVNNDEMTSKITGMLLELPPADVRSLTLDTTLLQSKVDEARTVLQQQ